ncbi:MAG TPA: cytochrome c3 family protein [Pyrinomonadaceae bacterium]
MKRRFVQLIIICLSLAAIVAAQTRRRPPARKPPAQLQAPRGSAAKYSAFLHSSDKHKSLECNACHKIPTTWTANRAFPDVADFPDHDACVRCHRPQFFTRQATIGTGPAICTVCHLRAAPREDRRFAFGKPNSANQTAKPKDERQFKIEFPHDKHQNVIAKWERSQSVWVRSHHRLKAVPQDDKKPDYNNCSLCHVTDKLRAIAPLVPGSMDSSLLNPFKSTPRTHDACFECHWKAQQPVGANCAGCHKPSETFVVSLGVKRISAKFAHEGGKGEHVLECTTCHINITRASTLRGLTPDVPINACAACHRDSKRTTYPKAVTIETELEQFKKTGNCTYCHTEDVGKKKPPPSHESSVQ